MELLNGVFEVLVGVSYMNGKQASLVKMGLGTGGGGGGRGWGDSGGRWAG